MHYIVRNIISFTFEILHVDTTLLRVALLKLCSDSVNAIRSIITFSEPVSEVELVLLVAAI